MIDIKAKIHDKFSIEFKVGFVVRRKLKENNFVINTWLFVPNSLDINPLTYSKNQFYRDVKSNIRLITPIFLLREIASKDAIPIHNIERSFRAMASDPSKANIGEYEYQIKMFAAIYKSAVRDEILHIFNNQLEDDVEYLCRSYIENVYTITSSYRDLRRIINVPTVPTDVLNYFSFGDEFISNITQQHTYRLIKYVEQKGEEIYIDVIKDLVKLIRNETFYKKEKGYLSIDTENKNDNRELVYRHGILKKYIESDLFLNARRKKDGVLVEQVYYSLAAGISMIFATTIAFSFQQKYGNFTMPLFVALVVSYMLKDRIKDLMRFYFAHRLGPKYFDNKTTISMKDIPIGWSKEGVDFITDNKVPREVMELRNRSPLVEAENRAMDEKIILYRKLVRIDRDDMDDNNEYNIAGINDIMRLHVNRFVQKMDNPEIPLDYLTEQDQVATLFGEKSYYMNIIMQLQFEDQIDYKRFRIVFNRMGISKLEELK